jgi:hypothetical protein
MKSRSSLIGVNISGNPNLSDSVVVIGGLYTYGTEAAGSS